MGRTVDDEGPTKGQKTVDARETCSFCNSEPHISQELRTKLYTNRQLYAHQVEATFYTPGERFWRWLASEHDINPHGTSRNAKVCHFTVGEALARSTSMHMLKIQEIPFQYDCPFCGEKKNQRGSDLRAHLACKHWEQMPGELLMSSGCSSLADSYVLSPAPSLLENKVLRIPPDSKRAGHDGPSCAQSDKPRKPGSSRRATPSTRPVRNLGALGS